MFKRITIVTGIIAGLTGSIYGIAQAYPIVHPWVPVTHWELQLVMDQYSAAIDRQTLFQLEEYLNRAKADMKTAPSATVQQRIDALNKQIQETQGRIDKTRR